MKTYKTCRISKYQDGRYTDIKNFEFETPMTAAKIAKMIGAEMGVEFKFFVSDKDWLRRRHTHYYTEKRYDGSPIFLDIC